MAGKRQKGFAIFLFGILMLGSAAAQPMQFGIKGGLVTPKLKTTSDNEYSKNYEARLAYGFGLFARKRVSGSLWLQVELLYMQQGGVRDDLQPIDTKYMSGFPTDLMLYAEFNNEVILDYLEVPVLAKFQLSTNKDFNFYVDLGPYFGYLLNAKIVASGESQIYVDNTGETPITDLYGNPVPPADFGHEQDISGDIRDYNIGVSGGLGFEFFTSAGEFVIDLRGSMGFTNIQLDPKYGENQTGTLVMSLGYVFN